jgi:hypothetical protein
MFNKRWIRKTILSVIACRDREYGRDFLVPIKYEEQDF